MKAYGKGLVPTSPFANFYCPFFEKNGSRIEWKEQPTNQPNERAKLKSGQFYFSDYQSATKEISGIKN